MNKRRITTAILAIFLLSVFWITPRQARAQGEGWSEPYRLSSEDGRSSEAYMVADQYGYLHVFWSEQLFSNGWSVIKYSRFDGTTWTKPNDIHFTGAGIKNVSPVVDRDGILHIVWSEGSIGIAYYSYAPARDALSVQNWSKPLKIDVPARPVYLRVDSKGIFHVLYVNETQESGVYYVRSEDHGISWSEPLWVDPDIRPGYVPDSLSFEIDENDGLHAAWFYGYRDDARGLEPDWVRYSHSLDGGHTWSAPYTIDKYVEGSDHNLTNASPNLIVQGQTVHVIWAAGHLPFRYHSYSTDAGETWSAPVQIFGELHGQAFDGLAVDGAGRVHLFTQIRYPVGIYHAYWDENGWSVPSLVYLIALEGSEEGFGDRVHAHHTRPAVRAGNQLVLTFADGPADPNRRLFVTYMTLDDIPPLESMPTPTAWPNPSPVSGQTTQLPESTATPPPLESAGVGSTPAPDLAIRVALVPTLLVLGGMLAMQLFYKRRR